MGTGMDGQPSSDAAAMAWYAYSAQQWHACARGTTETLSEGGAMKFAVLAFGAGLLWAVGVLGLAIALSQGVAR
jgi:hypothetical protein